MLENGTKALGGFLRHRGGNIGLTFSLLVVPLVVSVGAALDFQYAYNERIRLQNDLDAALLQAIHGIDTDNSATIKANIRKWMTARYSSAGNFELDDNIVTIDTATGSVSTEIRSSVKTSFLNVIGVSSIPIAVKSTVNSGETVTSQNAFSMYMVLDRSGSMDEATNTIYTYSCGSRRRPRTCSAYYTKIESLKIAVSTLTTQIATADPDAKYARTAAVSYNSSSQTPVNLAFGTTHVDTYVTNLTATGGTDSSGAIKIAYDALVDASDNSAHAAKNGKTPDKFIVLMTDGDNNTLAADTTTRTYCDRARTAKIRIFTIAFMAPSRGQALLSYCATNPSDYFTPDTTSELVNAFKIIGQTSSKTSVRVTN